LFAALEVATGQVTDACYPRHRHQEFLRFLQRPPPPAAGDHATNGRAGNSGRTRHRGPVPAGRLGSARRRDWYDTVPLPSQQILLAVGDIAGHGIDAVTGMVALRNCLRGLAITGAGPARLLEWLNQVANHLTDGIIGTAVCCLYDPATRTLRWARAGHPPPVLVRDGSATEVGSDPDLLLGADPAASYHEVTTSLCRGDRLLLFTDGLIERRDQPIDQALDSLLRGQRADRPPGRLRRPPARPHGFQYRRRCLPGCRPSAMTTSSAPPYQVQGLLVHPARG